MRLASRITIVFQDFPSFKRGLYAYRPSSRSAFDLGVGQAFKLSMFGLAAAQLRFRFVFAMARPQVSCSLATGFRRPTLRR